VAVRTGRSGDGRTEILSGLEGGEPVVVSGQFLIDSEASLSGALGRLTAGEGAKSGDPGKKQERKCEVEYWHDPMVPDQHFDKPGKSPFMDMMLVPGFTPESSPDCTIDDVEMEVPAATRPREVGEGDEGAQP
jgi:Cu(I)/Ag(I) efflux system membrane fusion protein